MTLREIVWKAFGLFSNAPSFQRLENPAFASNLHNLMQLTTGLQPSHLGLHPDKIEHLRCTGRAPVWYMSIIDATSDDLTNSEGSDEDPLSFDSSLDNAVNTPRSSLNQDPASVMTVAAFALKPGARLPLHDHPKMFGILKVLSGNLTLQSYSSVKCLSTTADTHSITQLLAEKSEIMHMTADSGPLLLHKNRQDVHEISNDSDVLGLFIDILSPPYDRRLRDNWPRQQSDRYVTYYREAGVASPEVMKEVVSSTDLGKKYFILEEIPCPSYYTTDQIPYQGESLR